MTQTVNEKPLELLPDLGAAHWNCSVAQLVEQSIARGEASLAANGALTARTGKHTGRSAEDKYVVENAVSEGQIWWHKGTKPMSQHTFDALLAKVQQHMRGREVFVLDAIAGADPASSMPIRVVTEMAWHSLFAFQLFRRLSREQQAQHQPQWTVMSVPSFKPDPAVDGTRSNVAIMIDFSKQLVLIVGTAYAGEIKKSIFTVMNFVLPQRKIMPMHCSANVSYDGQQVALFFGLSGTGKTTLSADSTRRLIGDDEHGWGENGVFNFEGGCYAKCIRLSEEDEPEIFRAIRFGSVIENVVLDEETRIPNYDDASLTENTRVAYPLEYIPHVVEHGTAGHADVIFFLTADAFGVLPPIAELTTEQALYYFLSGYTAKLAGTEVGLGSEPQATFSTCFGSPFMPRFPTVYAELLGEKLRRHGSKVYLLNTGWTGGPFGVGSRIKLRYTRAMVHAALDGTIAKGEFRTDPLFGLRVPVQIEGVPTELLTPRETWDDTAIYDEKARQLAERFINNFKQFEEQAGPQVTAAGPRIS